MKIGRQCMAAVSVALAGWAVCVGAAPVDYWSYEANVLPANASPAWTTVKTGSSSESIGTLYDADTLFMQSSGSSIYLNYTLADENYWHAVAGKYRCDFRIGLASGQSVPQRAQFVFNIATNQYRFSFFSTNSAGMIVLEPGQATNTGGYAGQASHAYRFEYNAASQAASLSLIDDPENPFPIFTNAPPSSIVSASNYIQFGRSSLDSGASYNMYAVLDYIRVGQIVPQHPRAETNLTIAATNMIMTGVDAYAITGVHNDTNCFVVGLNTATRYDNSVMIATDTNGNQINARGEVDFALPRALPDGDYRISVMVLYHNFVTYPYLYPIYIIEYPTTNGSGGYALGQRGWMGAAPTNNAFTKPLYLCGSTNEPIWGTTTISTNCIALRGCDGVTNRIKIRIMDENQYNYTTVQPYTFTFEGYNLHVPKGALFSFR